MVLKLECTSQLPNFKMLVTTLGFRWWVIAEMANGSPLQIAWYGLALGYVSGFFSAWYSGSHYYWIRVGIGNEMSLPLARSVFQRRMKCRFYGYIKCGVSEDYKISILGIRSLCYYCFTKTTYEVYPGVYSWLTLITGARTPTEI